MKSVNILGAGIAGMSAANFLAQSGFKATVYENVVLLAAPEMVIMKVLKIGFFRKSYRFFKKIGLMIRR